MTTKYADKGTIPSRDFLVNELKLTIRRSPLGLSTMVLTLEKYLIMSNKNKNVLNASIQNAIFLVLV